MTCEKLESLWVSYLDGKLSVQEQALVDAHVSECGACEARREGFLAVARELESWEAPAPSPWFDARLRQRIAADAAAPAGVGWLGFLSPGFPISLAALLFLAALLIWSGSAKQTLPPQNMRVSVEKMDDLIHVIEEVELLSDAEFLVELKKPVSGDARTDRP